MKPEAARPNGNDARWPLSQMLLRGTFATGTAAEHRLATRSTAIFAVVFAWVAFTRVTHWDHQTMIRVISILLIAPALTYYAWEKRKYFLSLDELPRRIEMEGMAWAYTLGVLVALWAGSFAYAASIWWPQFSFPASWFLLFMFAMFLAIVKGTYRYFATRRY